MVLDIFRPRSAFRGLPDITSFYVNHLPVGFTLTRQLFSDLNLGVADGGISLSKPVRPHFLTCVDKNP